MKLDFLPDERIIRLRDFSATDPEQLITTISELICGRVSSLAVHELPFAESVSGCSLTLCCDSRDRGFNQSGPAEFTCRLTVETWDNVRGLMEPFAVGVMGFQWLDSNHHDDVRWLISVDGQW